MRKSADQEKLQKAYRILQKKGYNPIDQIVGFLLTDDPTYITSAEGARKLVAGMETEKVLCEIVESYFDSDGTEN